MEVAGQTLDDAAVVEFLALMQSALESMDTEVRRFRMLSRRSPFGEQWLTVIFAGRALFGMPELEG